MISRNGTARNRMELPGTATGNMEQYGTTRNSTQQCEQCEQSGTVHVQNSPESGTIRNSPGQYITARSSCEKQWCTRACTHNDANTWPDV
eukprot:gene10195-biopygen4764